jgi:hypothetical protein
LRAHSGLRKWYRFFAEREVFMQQWRFRWYFCVTAFLLLSGRAANGYVGGAPPQTGGAITLNWESPADGQEISGVQTFRGFAYSSAPSKTISIKLLVAGASFDVPWGFARADVAAGGGQANSGFGTAENVGNLPPGPVAITLEVREAGSSGDCAAPGCVRVIRNFTVAKPGARDGEVAPFRFLNGLDPAGANLALDGEEIIVAPVTVQDSDGGTRQSTLRLRWLQNTQAFGTVDAASGTSFAAVQEIFTQRCAVTGCHDGATRVQFQNLSPGRAFLNLVAIKSTEDPSRLRVNPGNATASYLFQKIIPNGTVAPGPGRMPLVGGFLSQSESDTIAGWINEGAPPPQ